MLMAWNMAHISQNDRFCDFEDCIDSTNVESSDKKAKTKNSDNSEVIKASDDTSDKSFFLDSNVDYSNIDLLVEGAKNTLANM
ncbi:25997_t:CDS:2 [Gigaspora rosea]|nr:25997_t:CDS:2 [Gigaspora rosea]